jgi:hypothetical protein
MQELTFEQVEEVGGGVDWGAVGAGAGMVAVGIMIAGTPVGWVGAAGATMFSFAGGFSIGSGIRNDIPKWLAM